MRRHHRAPADSSVKDLSVTDLGAESASKDGAPSTTKKKKNHVLQLSGDARRQW